MQASQDSKALLCCGKPCHKALPNCPHVCQQVCHAGPCPGAAAEGCQEEVTVRCSCRRHKAKLPCHQVTFYLGRNSTDDSLHRHGLSPLLCAHNVSLSAQQSRRKRRTYLPTPVGVGYGRPWLDQWRPGPRAVEVGGLCNIVLPKTDRMPVAVAYYM